MESDHDVFYDHDILIAINFLEPHEKEIIIEKVLPRMKMMLKDVEPVKKAAIENKIAIEKRLLDIDIESEMQENVKKARYDRETIATDADQTHEEIEIEDDEEDNDEDVVANIKQDHMMTMPAETLTETSRPPSKGMNKEPEPESEFTDCDVCHQSVRKSVLNFHRKSHISAADPKMSECPHCKKMLQNTSMWRHKQRCSALKMSNSISQESTANKTSEQSTPVNFQCKICFMNFPKLANLKWHTTEEHSMDLQDVEQMLSENSADNVNKPDKMAGIKLDPDMLEKVMKSAEAAVESMVEKGKYKCKYCDDIFVNRSNAKRHENRRHPEIVYNTKIMA